MAKVKRQTYTLNMYLEKMRDLDIRSDADVQLSLINISEPTRPY